MEEPWSSKELFQSKYSQLCLRILWLAPEGQFAFLLSCFQMPNEGKWKPTGNLSNVGNTGVAFWVLQFWLSFTENPCLFWLCINQSITSCISDTHLYHSPWHFSASGEKTDSFLKVMQNSQSSFTIYICNIRGKARPACPARIIFPWLYQLLLKMPEQHSQLCAACSGLLLPAEEAIKSPLMNPVQPHHPCGPELMRLVIRAEESKTRMKTNGKYFKMKIRSKTSRILHPITLEHTPIQHHIIKCIFSSK